MYKKVEIGNRKGKGKEIGKGIGKERGEGKGMGKGIELSEGVGNGKEKGEIDRGTGRKRER